ncbi:ATP-dependent nuclease subunit B [Streptococcus sp. SL1232]|uniref:ATP-dependent nuclease subunit B n=1 Tax=Streptococcus vicugnae TaxID=2740579 RepID=UPI0018F42D36|nr:ATP-dependent nuclease subunit B [Streptococcus vicugnae]MBJ7541255.1 ATP-dependent nuclease subunit B [Streptococcus vicugnae]
MKLLYTDIQFDMTEILAREAALQAEAGKRVFYIAPNSLSFEKERAVLELLPDQASFAITITRFAQMARYFVFNESQTKESIDDNGLAMIFYRALSHFSDTDLKVFGRLKQDTNFIKQLVDLYKELKTANMTVLDLTELHSAEKQEDLVKIFLAVNDILLANQYDNQTKIAFFAKQLAAGHLDAALENVVLVIDGFTRFSAEEEHLVSLLEEKCAQVIIGTYSSQKAYKANFSTGNVYQASLDFLRSLAAKFQTQPQYVESSQKSQEAFAKLSKLFEAKHDFTTSDITLTDDDKKHYAIWDVINQKEEVEHVAKAIRHKLHQGYRYKDILVLLGDVDSYRLQIGKIFDKYDIPYYFGKAESMSDHPLVHFIDSLERVKRYRFRTEDVVNLLKTGLYGSFKQDDLDLFEQYLIYADIKGQSKFAKEFTIAYKGEEHLAFVNSMREQIMTPLLTFFKAQKQLGSSLLEKLMTFLRAISLPNNLESMVATFSENEQEKHEQVWRTFTGILRQFQTIFGQEKLSLDEFLSLLRSGMLAAQYRVVPASVDVVSVKSYDLVEPHTNKFVFALGMTQSHFPKIAQNRSLISDEERAKVNESTNEHQHFDIISRENIKKNHFAALSLFNSATDELVLSLPQIVNESEDKESSYLAELASFGVPVLMKGRNRLSTDVEDIGNYKALLSRVIEVNRLAIEEERELSKEEQTFWSVAVRYLRRRLATEGIELPLIKDNMRTKPVSAEVIETRFPSDQPINLSSSAVTTFYNNQYKYFLQYVLGLQEVETIHPDARNHGTYLHRVFEVVMKDGSNQPFDHKLNRAIQATNSEDAFKFVYEEDEESRYSLTVLEDIARSTATVLQQDAQIQVESEEEPFELMIANAIRIRGIIDRVDRLSDGSLGVVDYKSSHNTFDIQKFYNGLNPQLVTYMQALRDKKERSESDKIFGAMYLHMQEPKVDLSSVATTEKILENLSKELRYRGLFLEEEKGYLANGNYHLNDSVYTQEELDILLAYNKKLFIQAAKDIKKGHFLINPYSEDGKTVKGDQLKAITRFEADRHMPYARKWFKLPRKDRRQGFLNLMQEEEEKDDL